VTSPPSLETVAVVALLRTRNAPHLADRLEERGSALALLEEAQRGVDVIAPRLFNGEGSDMETLLDNAASDIARWEALGMRTLTILDRDYPGNLRAVHDRPPLVFVRGSLSAGDSRSVAVIGTRRASDRGLRAAARIAEHLVGCGYTVVSGLAAGIDSAAHRSALAFGGRTVAVIGTGLARCYPAQNAALQQRIGRDGAVVSRFWPDEPPTRQSFPLRNAVMSGLALATVVVEAGMTSGARLQARLALAHGRPVFMLASLLEQRWARELAERPATHVISSPEEIVSGVERLTSGALVT
jgi:DNA processing protein